MHQGNLVREQEIPGLLLGKESPGLDPIKVHAMFQGQILQIFVIKIALHSSQHMLHDSEILHHLSTSPIDLVQLNPLGDSFIQKVKDLYDLLILQRDLYVVLQEDLSLQFRIQFISFILDQEVQLLHRVY